MGKGARNKRSYRLGVIKGFHEKLDHQARERMKQHTGGGMVRRGFENDRHATMSALICSEDKVLKSFVTMRFPRLSSYRSQRATIDPDMYQAGVQDGKDLNLHKGIERRDGNRGRLLSGGSG